MEKETIEKFIAEFNEKFSHPHWEITGYNLNKVEEFIRTSLSTLLREEEERIVEFISKQKDHRDPETQINKLIDAHQLVCWLQEQAVIRRKEN